jgi:hypothetical protein
MGLETTSKGKVFQWLEILLELVLLSISFHFDKQIGKKKKEEAKIK